MTSVRRNCCSRREEGGCARFDEVNLLKTGQIVVLVGSFLFFFLTSWRESDEKDCAQDYFFHLQPPIGCPTMPSGGNKKSPAAGGSRGKSSKKAPVGNEAAAAVNTSAQTNEDQNSGFAEYLRSSQGSEMLKLFVVANSIVMFLTVAWPQMKKSYEMLMSYFGEDGEDEF